MGNKEKVKAYGEDIERTNKSYDNEITEEIFPELKENKDERIKKAIIEFFESEDDNTTYSLVRKKDIIAWLEKQGKEEYALKSFKDEDVRKFMQYIEKQAKAYEFNLPNRSYDIYAFAKDILVWLEKQGKKSSWKPSKKEMDVLYSLSYITNKYDEHKEDVITHLYQDLKREFFNDSSYENMFSLDNKEDDVRRRSTIQVLEYARSLDAYNQYGKADIDKNISWLEKQRDKDKLIQELGEYKVKYTQEVLEKYINSMSNKDDERLRKTAIAFLKDFAEQGYENAVECIDWLEKQGFALDNHQFINVTDGLPKQDEEVIVLCDELNTAPCYKIAFGHTVDKTICKDYNGWNIPNVVYWFPMPKLSSK